MANRIFALKRKMAIKRKFNFRGSFCFFVSRQFSTPASQPSLLTPGHCSLSAVSVSRLLCSSLARESRAPLSRKLAGVRCCKAYFSGPWWGSLHFTSFESAGLRCKRTQKLRYAFVRAENALADHPPFPGTSSNDFEDLFF